MRVFTSFISFKASTERCYFIYYLGSILLTMAEGAMVRRALDIELHAGNANSQIAPAESFMLNHGEPLFSTITTNHDDGSFTQEHRLNLNDPDFHLQKQSLVDYRKTIGGGHTISHSDYYTFTGDKEALEKKVKSMPALRSLLGIKEDVALEGPNVNLNKFLEGKPKEADNWKFLQYLEENKDNLGLVKKIDQNLDYNEKLLENHYENFQRGKTEQLRLEGPSPHPADPHQIQIQSEIPSSQHISNLESSKEPQFANKDEM
ncbi:hypothetical protein BY996DRAFT_2726644 [Phakopsora pachyrhizi]|nr:hypothetical protein BY996DRAFT_2725837 [Phakopsora pachyrhizi]KAI8453403.1 hypothetical protein BY996DRAFT_2726644 [Phakopsora pachyrhizi]